MDAPTQGATAEQPAPAKRTRKGTGLSGMVLPELQQMASGLGIAGIKKMRKGELIEAIKAKQGGGTASAPRQESLLESGGAASSSAASSAPATEARATEAPASEAPADGGKGQQSQDRSRTDGDNAGRQDGGRQRENRQRDNRQNENRQNDRDGSPRENAAGNQRDQDGNQRQQREQDGNQRQQREQDNRGDRDNDNRDNRQDNRQDRDNRGNNNRNFDDDDNGGGRGRRRRRGRDRNRNNRDNRDNRGRGQDRDNEPQIAEDDVLIPIAGILDVLDNYAFVRTSGYLTGSNDVYVSLSQVRKYGLRRGDAITGAVKAPREGERREKFNALVRLDTINGLEPDAAKDRPDFYKLTPLYPQDRLRLETENGDITTRMIDLVMPLGKGQRALVVSPPKAGKTTVLQKLANSIAENNPECHLMVVLVDERPEEVTDMQRSVKGEVIASTFDRPPTDHTTVAELSIERAKRLVELGHDVVVLLESITRLGRAYNLAAPASGRILSGGVDSTALYPPKRFLGAARNIENGGSLTIIATALVETGSMMDTVIFEEFKGTSNAELKLDRKIADKRVYPAIDVDASGTRREDILLSREELAIVIKLRRILAALEPIEALDLLMKQMKKTRTNGEFLMQVAKNTPGQDNG
ncbi:hypothetical protein GCM10027298_09120 [Epidermidibacterium keratini]